MTQEIDILTHLESGVLTLTFNRPGKKNALTRAMYSELKNTLHRAQNDDDIRVVVIQGHTTVFSSGNDIAEFVHLPPALEDLPNTPVFEFLRALAQFPKPVIAAVCGPAVGIGATLLLHCDLVYAGDNAIFAMPFVNLGLVPEAASSLLLPQLLGYHRAAEVLLLGEPFIAEAALEVGFLNKVLPPTETNDYAQSVAQKLAAKPIASVLATKKLMKAGQQPAIDQRMQEEAAVFARLLQEPAAQSILKNFLIGV